MRHRRSATAQLMQRAANAARAGLLLCEARCGGTLAEADYQILAGALRTEIDDAVRALERT